MPESPNFHFLELEVQDARGSGKSEVLEFF